MIVFHKTLIEYIIVIGLVFTNEYLKQIVN